MSDRLITFSPRARERMEEIADYLYTRHLSSEFVIKYLQDLEDWLDRLLGDFQNPERRCLNLGKVFGVWSIESTVFSTG